MKEIIVNKLHEIEKKENVKILFAVESGSRAWGFESVDSDYDVRFIYIRKNEDYLRLDDVRDVIELPLDDVFDINGWDLQKALRLMYKSNPALFEWFSSPFVYIADNFAYEIKKVSYKYFSKKKILSHYVHMAENNYQTYLEKENVIVKKYFYVLRPILACKWIMEFKSVPPMLFSELMETELDTEMKDIVLRLLNIKTNATEVQEIPQIPELNAYLAKQIDTIKEAVKKMKDKNSDWDALNALFLRALNEVN